MVLNQDDLIKEAILREFGRDLIPKSSLENFYLR